MSLLRGIHHVAYRCHDALETVRWYQRHLDMDFQIAFSEDNVPSTGAFDPYMHVFLDAGNGNVLAFFELPTQAKMGRDENTPTWVQHLALEVADLPTLLDRKAKLEEAGIEVIGPTDHTLFVSIYFFDPNGHRLELTVRTHRDDLEGRLNEVRWEMLEEWAKTKRAPAHAKWLHDGSISPSDGT